MPGSMSDFLENKILDHVLVASYTPPATIYVALFTVVPTDAGGGTEVSAGGYARQTSTFDAAAAGATANAGVVTWTASGAAFGTVVAFGLFDALTVGNLLFWATLTTDRVVNDGDTAEFAIGDLDLTLD